MFVQKLSWNLINQFVAHFHHLQNYDELNGGQYGNKGWISINFFVAYDHQLLLITELIGGRDEI